jgi:hypothetical protein
MNQRAAVGPVLKDGLTIKPVMSLNLRTDSVYLKGARVFLNGIEVFTVNEMGRRLLSMADGTATLGDMIKELNLEKNAADAGMFFITLGEAGFLKNKVEIMLYETVTSEDGDS